MAAIGKIKLDRFGNIQELGSDKMKALELLSRLIGAEDGGKKGRPERSGRLFSETMQKLRGFNKENSSEDTKVQAKEDK